MSLAPRLATLFPRDSAGETWLLQAGIVNTSGCLQLGAGRGAAGFSAAMVGAQHHCGTGCAVVDAAVELASVCKWQPARAIFAEVAENAAQHITITREACTHAYMHLSRLVTVFTSLRIGMKVGRLY